MYKQTKPNWLPTLNLRCEDSNSGSTSRATIERYERTQGRNQRRIVNLGIEVVLPTMMASKVDAWSHKWRSEANGSWANSSIFQGQLDKWVWVLQQSNPIGEGACWW